MAGCVPREHDPRDAGWGYRTQYIIYIYIYTHGRRHDSHRCRTQPAPAHAIFQHARCTHATARSARGVAAHGDDHGGRGVAARGGSSGASRREAVARSGDVGVATPQSHMHEPRGLQGVQQTTTSTTPSCMCLCRCDVCTRTYACKHIAAHVCICTRTHASVCPWEHHGALFCESAGASGRCDLVFTAESSRWRWWRRCTGGGCTAGRKSR